MTKVSVIFPHQAAENPARGLLANLDFEYAIAGRAPANAVRAQLQRWSSILRLLPGCERAEGTTSPLIAWGLDSALYEIADNKRSLPSPECIKRVNDKRFSHRLEVELGIALPGAKIVEDLEELESQSQTMGAWVLKDPFGVSARERILGQGPATRTQLRWALKHLRATGGLVLEPWVHVHDLYSLQFDLTDQQVRWLGAVESLTDGRGTFRGHRYHVHPFCPLPLQNIATRAAQKVWSEGYRGAMGVDAFEGALDGSPITRPLVEINARVTFGRLALALGQSLARDFCWHHHSDQDVKVLPEVSSDAEPGSYRLPDHADPMARSGTWIELL